MRYNMHMSKPTKKPDMKKIYTFTATLALVVGAMLLATLWWVNTSDSQVFRNSYPRVPNNHVFRPVTADEAKTLLKQGTGVLFLGFPQCPWCQTLVPYLDSSAKVVGVRDIAYFDVRQDRADNSTDYRDLVEVLKPYLDNDETGQPRIYVPHFVVVKNGKIVGSYKIELPEDDTDLTPETYWTEETIAIAQQQIKHELQKLD